MFRSLLLLAVGAVFGATFVGLPSSTTASATGQAQAALSGRAATTAAADVTDGTTYAMPSTGTVRMLGRGYGHGHGMSQYGAEGAGRQGRTWGQIMSFYFPGTTLGRTSGYIRVHITADTDRFTEVGMRSRLVVRNVSTGETFALPSSLTSRWRLSSASNGVSRIEFKNSNNRWQVWRHSAGTLEFYAGNYSIELFVGNTSVRYRGALRSGIPTAGSTARQTVNVLPLDHYLQGVVAREMPASWSASAIRSQAVAARTYAAYERQSPRSKLFDLCDTTSCQVYGGVAAEHPNTTAAIRHTEGRIVTYGGAPAFTQFSSSNGGWTAENSRVPYMPAKQDPYDGWSGNPNHTWSLDLDVSKVERAWPSIGNLDAIRIQTRDGNGEWNGRVKTLVLMGSQRDLTVYANDFRTKLRLKSTWFTFDAPVC